MSEREQSDIVPGRSVEGVRILLSDSLKSFEHGVNMICFAIQPLYLIENDPPEKQKGGPADGETGDER